MELMMMEKKKRGGQTKPDHLKAKNKTFKLYDWETEKVRQFIRSLRKS